MTRVELDEARLTAWGEKVGASVTPPLVLALRGDLGAGKTTLARAIARGAGVLGPIPSPTYNLLFRYRVPRGFDLVHVDLYRLEEAEQVWALGWSELPAADEVVIIEWPSRAEDLLPLPRWEVFLEEAAGGETRDVRIRAIGEPPGIALPEMRP